MSSALFPPLAPPVFASLFAGLSPTPAAALDPAAWTPDVARRIATRRLSEHGLWIAREHSIELPSETRDLLETAAHTQALVAMRLRTIGAELQQILQDRGIESLGIKGAAVGDLHGEDLPRYYGDVDLLVSPSDFERSIEAYESEGYRPIDSVSPWTRRFGSSANLSRGSGREVDVQRTIRPRCWGRRLEFGQLLHRSRVVNGTRVLGVEDALIATALAQIADTRTNTSKLVPWRDLVVLSRIADAEVVASIAREARLSNLVAVALSALPEDPQRVRLVGLLDSAGAMSVPTRVRFATFSHTGWTENWFVRLIREVPATQVPVAVGALVILPPANMTTWQWWRHCVAVRERRRNAKQARRS